jgi:hypothetical protein
MVAGVSSEAIAAAEDSLALDCPSALDVRRRAVATPSDLRRRSSHAAMIVPCGDDRRDYAERDPVLVADGLE